MNKTTTDNQSTQPTLSFIVSFPGKMDDVKVQEDGSMQVKVVIPRAMARALAGAALLSKETIPQHAQRALIHAITSETARFNRACHKTSRAFKELPSRDGQSEQESAAAGK